VIVFAGVPVTEYEPGRSWYEAFFGRPPDLLPNDNEAAWRLAGDGWVYVVGDAVRAGSGLVTILVEDLDERLAALASRGIASDDVESYANGVRKVTFADPDGNAIAIGQVPAS